MAIQNTPVTTNINAIQIDYVLNDDSVKTYYFYGKQDLPPAGQSSAPVPIRADIFLARNELVTHSVNTVTVAGSTVIQPPSIKSIAKEDLTSTMTIELPNPSAVSVYFGFQDKAGIASYDIFEKDTGEFFIRSGTVDMHSSSDTIFVAVKGVELASGLDDTKAYVLRIKHTGTANPSVFDSGFDHKIFVGDVQIHRNANTDQSILEFVSNTAFTNSSFPDDGSQNSITGRTNFIEFFSVQTDKADGVSSTFRIKTPTINVRSVELDNGRGFKKLNRFIDWITTFNESSSRNQSVVLSFVPKENAVIRITFDVFSFNIQRKIEITQPRTFDGRYDRFANIYVNNEASYIEINALQSASV